MTFKYFKIQKKVNLKEKKLLESIDHSFKRVDMFNLLKKEIKIKNKEIIISKKKIKFLNNKQIYVVAFGKMADTMIMSSYKIFAKTRNVSFFSISNKLEKKFPKNIIRYKSQHPLPGKLSLIATKKLVEFLKKIERDSIIIFLVSGGGSSMLANPINGVSINKKIRLTKKLFSLNTEPKYLNYCRIALSRIKNGGLLQYLKTDNIFNFFVSDENEDKIEILSSGPTVNKRQKFKKQIFNFFNQNQNVKKLIGKKHFVEIEKNLNLNISKKTHNKILLKNHDFIRVLKREIKNKQKVDVIASKKFLFGSYDINLNNIEKILYFVNRKKKNFVYIIGCQIETPMNAKSVNNMGGRLQHITADLVLRNSFKNIKMIAIATDGQDYDLNIFGTIIDFGKKYNKDEISKYIKKKITKKFHLKNKSLITKKQNSNLNLKDVIIIYNFN